MRGSCSTRVIFTGILLVGLVTGCSDQDKPKEKITNRKTTVDTIASKNIEHKTEEQQPQLPKIILIITSKACDCTLERCAEAEKIVNEVVQQLNVGPNGRSPLHFEKFDYAKEQDLVAQLAKEYQLRFLPTLLFFDKKGAFKAKLDGSLGKGEIEKKLKELGVE